MFTVIYVKRQTTTTTTGFTQFVAILLANSQLLTPCSTGVNIRNTEEVK